MNLHDAWEQALKNTEIVRTRVQDLHTFADTAVPYIFLSKSEVDGQDTVVRKGNVLVRRPAIILPPNMPQLEGFESDSLGDMDEQNLASFLFVRGISLPSLQYNNTTHSLDIYEGELNRAVDHFLDQLAKSEDVHTGLVAGLNEYWQLSLLIFICTQVDKSANSDIRRLIDQYKKKNN